MKIDAFDIQPLHAAAMEKAIAEQQSQLFLQLKGAAIMFLFALSHIGATNYRIFIENKKARIILVP